ncbi:MAG: (d)CMP kinase [Thermoplasmata archaeon]
MSVPLVTVTGPAGSGKSTAGREAAQQLGLEYRSAGEVFRAEARRHGMDLAEFSRYAETHDEVDRTLDDAMLQLARPGRLLDGRLIGALARRRGIPVLYVVITARPHVRFERLARRDDQSDEEARRLTTAREASENARYRRLYGIDLEREVPDLTIDSSDLPAGEVARRLVASVRELASGAP